MSKKGPTKDSPRSLIDGTLLDDYAGWLPTPEEIAAECQKIRAENIAAERDSARRVEETYGRQSANESVKHNAAAMAKVRRRNRRRAAD